MTTTRQLTTLGRVKAALRLRDADAPHVGMLSFLEEAIRGVR